MRNAKLITCQDHLLIIIESTEQDNEITCVNRVTGKRSFPAQTTALIVDGVFNHFYEDGEVWTKHHTWNTPRIFFKTSNVASGGTSETANTRTIAILPKKREVLTEWINTVGENSINVAIDTSRDSHVTITEGTAIRKMSANTFIELPIDIIGDITIK
jgi:hypothetical protein